MTVVWLSNMQGEVQFMGTEVINGSIMQTDSLVTVFMHCEFHCDWRNRQEEEETEF